ncbi:MAG TPA: hypothetical protein VEJ23_09100 [Solirubrobacteraceae bacterium]|nr:hypothetical protein [Solirubrobacteraceae bacterium]
MGSGGLVLLVILFLVKWYEADVRLGSSSGLEVLGGSYNGWHAFTHSRWLWLVTAVVALGAVLLTLSGTRLDLGVRVGTVVLALSGLSVVTILYRVIHHPVARGEAPAHVRLSSSYGLELGIWIGLVAALAIACGGYLAMRDEAATIEASRDPAQPDAGRELALAAAAAQGAFSGLVVQGAAASRHSAASSGATSGAAPTHPPGGSPGQAPAGSHGG